MAGRKTIPNRVRFDCMVDKDLLAVARAKKDPNVSWPELVERMLRFLESGISTKELTTLLDLAISELEGEITSEYNVGSKRHKEFLAKWKAGKELVRAAKWAEHNRV